MIIENILPNFLQQDIYNLMTGHTFPYYWNENSILSGDVAEDTFQFVHIFYDDNEIKSDKFNLVLPILWFFEKETNIKIKSLGRIKANFNTKYNMTEKDKLNAVHTDRQEKNYLSLIYYVNDSDGDTIIYDDNREIEHRITPKQNNLVYFNSNKYHAGIFPIVNKKRIVINFVVEV